jgi:monofunctional biosynthetic peptidoglycan transglycosylase
MAKSKKTTRRAKKGTVAKGISALLQNRPVRFALRWIGSGLAGIAGVFLLLVLLFTFVNPPTTPYILSESWRNGGVSRVWVNLEDMAPDFARSVVAAEDANFCLHWGFDMKAIRAALDEGANRGASTLTQQVVKNVFLWQGRSWPRKALEALMTPVIELFWTKRRILEIYLNVAEMGKGVFGAEAASQRYFGQTAARISPRQAALIASALPDPKGRNPARPSGFLRNRAVSIEEGAATILADGRSSCFED